MYNLQGKKILVTGGMGFVGSNIVRSLVNEYNAIVTVVDDLFSGNVNHLLGIDYEFINGTIEDTDLVNKCVDGKDIVFHLAARNIIVSNKNPREDLQVNVIGTFNILNACKKYNVQRIVYTSTSSIYGNPTSLPIGEDDKKSFLNFYSASKFSAEIYAKTFYEVFDLPVSIVRYSNVYGFNQSPLNPYCGVIGRFFESAIEGQDIKIHGDGEQTRDFTFVNDAVAATISAAKYEKAIGNEYNIGTGVEISVNLLAELIIQIVGSKSKIVYIDRRDIDNIRRRIINIEKTRHDLKYQPQISIKAGLEATYNWYKTFFKVEL